MNEYKVEAIKKDIKAELLIEKELYIYEIIHDIYTLPENTSLEESERRRLVKYTLDIARAYGIEE